MKINCFETLEEVISVKQLSEQRYKKYDTGYTEKTD